MADTSIINVLLDAIKDHLTAQLMTNVSDESKAGLVQVGTLRDNPTDTLINLMVHPGDDEWKHELNVENNVYDSPTFEIGSLDGTIWMRRRFKVELSLYLDPSMSKTQARTVANLVLSRAEHAIWTMPMSGLTDTFGESAHRPFVRNSYIIESGGEGQYIWRGDIALEIVTVKD